MNRNRRSITTSPTTFLRKCCSRGMLDVALIFFLGIVVGRYLFPVPTNKIPTNASAEKKQGSGIAGSIHRLSETPIRNTSHKDTQGRPITKQQFLEPFAIPRVSGYSVATMLPGQTVEIHQHESMHEFFYVLKGTGIFTVRGDQVHVSPGTFLHVSPHELHEIVVPNDSPDGDLQFLLSGVIE